MDERTYVCPHCGGSGKLPARPFAPGDKLWWKGGGYGYENRIPVVAIRPTGKHSFKVSFVTAHGGLTVESAARISCLTFRDSSSDSADEQQV